MMKMKSKQKKIWPELNQLPSQYNKTFKIDLFKSYTITIIGKNSNELVKIPGHLLQTILENQHAKSNSPLIFENHECDCHIIKLLFSLLQSSNPDTEIMRTTLPVAHDLIKIAEELCFEDIAVKCKNHVSNLRPKLLVEEFRKRGNHSMIEDQIVPKIKECLPLLKSLPPAKLYRILKKAFEQNQLQSDEIINFILTILIENPSSDDYIKCVFLLKPDVLFLSRMYNTLSPNLKQKILIGFSKVPHDSPISEDELRAMPTIADLINRIDSNEAKTTSEINRIDEKHNENYSYQKRLNDQVLSTFDKFEKKEQKNITKVESQLKFVGEKCIAYLEKCSKQFSDEKDIILLENLKNLGKFENKVNQLNEEKQEFEDKMMLYKSDVESRISAIPSIFNQKLQEHSETVSNDFSRNLNIMISEMKKVNETFLNVQKEMNSELEQIKKRINEIRSELEETSSNQANELQSLRDQHSAKLITVINQSTENANEILKLDSKLANETNNIQKKFESRITELEKLVDTYKTDNLNYNQLNNTQFNKIEQDIKGVCDHTEKMILDGFKKSKTILKLFSELNLLKNEWDHYQKEIDSNLAKTMKSFEKQAKSIQSDYTTISESITQLDATFHEFKNTNSEYLEDSKLTLMTKTQNLLKLINNLDQRLSQNASELLAIVIKNREEMSEESLKQCALYKDEVMRRIKNDEENYDRIMASSLINNKNGKPKYYPTPGDPSENGIIHGEEKRWKNVSSTLTIFYSKSRGSFSDSTIGKGTLSLKNNSHPEFHFERIIPVRGLNVIVNEKANIQNMKLEGLNGEGKWEIINFASNIPQGTISLQQRHLQIPFDQVYSFKDFRFSGNQDFVRFISFDFISDEFEGGVFACLNQLLNKNNRVPYIISGNDIYTSNKVSKYGLFASGIGTAWFKIMFDYHRVYVTSFCAILPPATKFSYELKGSNLESLPIKDWNSLAFIDEESSQQPIHKVNHLRYYKYFILISNGVNGKVHNIEFVHFELFGQKLYDSVDFNFREANKN